MESRFVKGVRLQCEQLLAEAHGKDDRPVITCPKCQRKNRVGSLGRGIAKCGACGFPLGIEQKRSMP